MQQNRRIQLPRAALILIIASCAGVACQSGSLSMEDKDNAPSEMNTTNNAMNNAMNNVTPAPVVSGRVTLHRLNRVEYDNTVRDLFGLDVRPADAFPADDFGYGFNNIADVLTLSPLQVELYEQAADTLVEEAMRAPVLSTKQRVEAEAGEATVGGPGAEVWNLWSNGSVGQKLTLSGAGSYRITVRAWGTQAGPDPAKMEVLVDEATVKTFDVPNVAASPGTFTFETTIDGGEHFIAVGFTNDYYDEAASADRNLLVDWFEVEGPLGAVASTPARDRLMVCQPASEDDRVCAAQILSTFGRRAWRRPLEQGEIDRLLGFLDVAKAQEQGIDEGLKLAMKAMLLSPHFLFRVEQDRPELGEDHYLLSDHELASRLSYFLWSSMPDEVLLKLADEGQLQDEAVLRGEIKRMLADPRAVALVDNFATQWLYVDAIREVHPDYMLFPEFDQTLAAAMREETRLFIKELIFEDRPLSELFLADYTYLNEKLAAHYGIDGVTGDAMQRVQLPADSVRGGLLSHGSVLTARSYPDRTSPVLRGVWVLRQLMCSSPPPPPAGVEGLETSAPDESQTLRERLEQHRSNPTCAACHVQMDSIGFGLERFNAIGQWRDEDHGKAIDDFGDFPDGRSFKGPREMAKVLGEDKRLTDCVSQQLLTYATGRGLALKSGGADQPQIDALTKQIEADGASFQDAITDVILSDAFRKKQNPKTTP